MENHMMSHVSLFLSAMSLFFFVEFLIIYTIRIFFPLHFEERFTKTLYSKSPLAVRISTGLIELDLNLTEKKIG